jgi:hypothetical protein
LTANIANKMHTATGPPTDRRPSTWPPALRACHLAACHFAFDGVGRADGKGPQLRSVHEQFILFYFFFLFF